MKLPEPERSSSTRGSDSGDCERGVIVVGSVEGGSKDTVGS